MPLLQLTPTPTRNVFLQILVLGQVTQASKMRVYELQQPWADHCSPFSAILQPE